MSKNLVIVESPAKAKTIEKYLGKDYVVKSSFGHIRDLPKKGMSIDIEHNFEPSYEVSPEKKKTVAELKKAAKTAETIWLASDEDREGEAIAWHLAEALKLNKTNTKRIVFHEITKPAILAAIDNPRTVDEKLVDAQQARRILDRLVGYELSPVLWKKVRPGLSAGRVQSVAVRLIVEREREISDFNPEVTFKATAVFILKDGPELPAECPVKFKTEDEAVRFLELLPKSDFVVSGIEKKPASRNPSAPFTTSTLQQEASRRLGYSPRTTMMLAQRLYEAGHITYMRTDSLNLSAIALKAMGDHIHKEYGSEYYQSRTFKTKSAGAQEAHEAIRPTDVAKGAAGADEQQKKLYQLIWRRALASQMAPAKLEKTTVTIQPSKTKENFVAEGEILLFDGFLKVWGRSGDDKILPDLKQGDTLQLQSAGAEQSFSRPPARYTEASLVRALEEMGIGRPSTYAPTISTIQSREYVEKADVAGVERRVVRLSLEDGKVSRAEETLTTPEDKGKLTPTSTGEVVTDFLVKNFPEIVDYDFTKTVEDQFDDIADGKVKWQQMLASFYGPFHKTIENSADISRAEASQARELGTDPKSGKPVFARYGRFGPMLQIGTKDDEEKPLFAPMPEGVKLEKVTLEQALAMFKLPRAVGKTTGGEEIKANIGRFGPYVQVGKTYASIKGKDPHTITEAEAREAIEAKLKQAAEREIQIFASGIKVLNGPFGPYITDGKKNAKIPKDEDPKKLTEEKCKELLEAAPAKKSFRRRKK
jgi:DNA topoisomerase I